MEDIVIVGAGGFGKEVAWLAQTIGNFRVLGFLDDTRAKGEKFYGIEILGRVSDAGIFSDKSFVIAIGSPVGRKKVYEKLVSLDVNIFPNLISPNAILSSTAELGRGNIICPGVIITTDVKIGDFNIVNLNSTIGHDSCVHDFVTVAPLAAISGNVTLKECVEVGTAASIREKTTINNGGMLGMGSVLTKDIQENEIFVGVPAKFLKKTS